MGVAYQERRQEEFRLLVLKALLLICNLFLDHATKNLGGVQKRAVGDLAIEITQFEADGVND